MAPHRQTRHLLADDAVATCIATDAMGAAVGPISDDHLGGDPLLITGTVGNFTALACSSPCRATAARRASPMRPISRQRSIVALFGLVRRAARSSSSRGVIFGQWVFFGLPGAWCAKNPNARRTRAVPDHAALFIWRRSTSR
jgi:hypothetical protein